MGRACNQILLNGGQDYRFVSFGGNAKKYTVRGNIIQRSRIICEFNYILKEISKDCRIEEVCK